MTTKKEKVIGIIGGMGPQAGLDLNSKLFELIEHTRPGHSHTASIHADHDHLPVALLSFSARIPDRSAFLFGKTEENPAHALAEIARQLEGLGAPVAGIPCNTAHVPAIFDVLTEQLRASGHSIRILHMIEETVRHLQEEQSGLQRIGVLSTLAVYRFGLYRTVLEEAGLEVVLPDEEIVENVVNRTIFDSDFGLKAQSHPVSERARQNLLGATEHLREKGADAVILGCTELPLAMPEAEINGLPLVDPAIVLARALIRATYPEMLAEKEPLGK